LTGFYAEEVDAVDDLFLMGQQALDAQPFSRLFDAQLLTFTQGYAELAIPITPQIMQQHGYVHGGALSYLADNALTFAGGSVLGPAVLTAEYKINYLRPARGERLIARASVVSTSNRQAVCRCDVWAVQEGEETLCAAAQGTIVAFGERTVDSTG
jgi:uncharacterized protein (TIGR00369 family)